MAVTRGSHAAAVRVIVAAALQLRRQANSRARGGREIILVLLSLLARMIYYKLTITGTFFVS